MRWGEGGVRGGRDGVRGGEGWSERWEGVEWLVWGGVTLSDYKHGFIKRGKL